MDKSCLICKNIFDIEDLVQEAKLNNVSLLEKSPPESRVIPYESLNDNQMAMSSESLELLLVLSDNSYLMLCLF